MKKTLVLPSLLLLAAAAIAQTAPAQIKNPVSSALRDILPGRQKNTIAAVEAMPADKFNYKPTPDQMTFGHLDGRDGIFLAAGQNVAERAADGVLDLCGRG